MARYCTDNTLQRFWADYKVLFKKGCSFSLGSVLHIIEEFFFSILAAYDTPSGHLENMVFFVVVKLLG